MFGHQLKHPLLLACLGMTELSKYQVLAEFCSPSALLRANLQAFWSYNPRCRASPADCRLLATSVDPSTSKMDRPDVAATFAQAGESAGNRSKDQASKMRTASTTNSRFRISPGPAAGHDRQVAEPGNTSFRFFHSNSDHSKGNTDSFFAVQNHSFSLQSSSSSGAGVTARSLKNPTGGA